MEAAINIDCCELSNCKNDDQLLTNQIQYLAMYLDVYLETEIDQSSLQGPSEFAREKMCPRLTRYVAWDPRLCIYCIFLGRSSSNRYLYLSIFNVFHFCLINKRLNF